MCKMNWEIRDILNNLEDSNKAIITTDKTNIVKSNLSSISKQNKDQFEDNWEKVTLSWPDAILGQERKVRVPGSVKE